MKIVRCDSFVSSPWVMRWAVCLVHETILLLSLLIADAVQYFVNDASTSPFLRAAVDNGAHGLIAGCSWNVVILPEKLVHFLPSLLCCLLACLIDVDHFLVAASWRLNDATNLHRRPPFHASLPLISLSAFVSVLRLYLHGETAAVRGWPGWSVFCGPMALVAVTSHHARDALRRGIWLWPFHTTRHTPPLPAPLVYALTLTFPLFVSHCLYQPAARLASADVGETV